MQFSIAQMIPLEGQEDEEEIQEKERCCCCCTLAQGTAIIASLDIVKVSNILKKN